MVTRPDGENPQPIKANAKRQGLQAVTPVQIAAKHIRWTMMNGIVERVDNIRRQSRSTDGSKLERVSWLMGVNDPML